MFDFEGLKVYQKSKEVNRKVVRFLDDRKVDKIAMNQLKRASLSIMLNIAEGSGRRTNKEKRNFFVISRGSVFECVAIFDFLKDCEVLSSNEFDDFYNVFEQISRMLYAMIGKLS